MRLIGRAHLAPADRARGHGATVRAAASAAVVWLCTGIAGAGQLSVTFRNVAPLGSTATDQFGQSFTVTGMSGIAHRTGNEFIAVMDNSNKLVRISALVDATGALSAATIAGGITLAESRDFEGAAFAPPDFDSIYLSEEDTPAVHRFDLATGARLESLMTPAVFAHRRNNFGFESLTIARDGSTMWTANEEALTVDGPLSTQSAGSVVRLLRYAGAADGGLVPLEQFPYVTEPLHGSPISGSRSGMSDLLLTPDGRMIALERSLAFSAGGLFRTRIFELSTAGATEVSGLAGLEGASFAAASKVMLYSGDQQNLEGLALGVPLDERAGRWSLIGVVDDADPISVNRLAAFELAGVEPPARCAGDLDGSGEVDSTDLNVLLTDFGCPGPGCTGDADGDGDTDSTDLNLVLSVFGLACP